jgi:hypothetical protein
MERARLGGNDDAPLPSRREEMGGEGKREGERSLHNE